jgi:hypothetical protein
MGEKMKAYRVLVGKPEGTKPPGRPGLVLKWILKK